MCIVKIAIIVRRLDVKGGTQRQALSLANELKKRGHEVTLYAFFYSAEKCYPDLLTPFKAVVLDPAVARPPVFPRLANIPLLRYLATIVAIRHETKSAKALARLIDPDTELLNPHDRVAHRAVAFFKRRLRDIPSVWNTNDTHSMLWGVDKLADIDPAYDQPWWKRAGYRIRDRYENARYIGAQDAIVVVDEFNCGLMKNYFGRDAIVVRNGPNMDHFAYRERTPPSAAVRLLTSGIFFPHRRFEDAIEAVKILRNEGINAALNIIGDPESDPAYAQKLRTLVAGQGLENHIHFLGKVSEEELLRQYQTGDIYLYPHHLQSDGLSPFEALATGMPIIVSRSAGAHEVVRDRETGLIVNPKDPAGIARAVRDLCEHPALYRKLSAEGSAFVRANFSWSRYADGMLAVYESVSKHQIPTSPPVGG